jgi:Holliday junction DNA helicase RuvB
MRRMEAKIDTEVYESCLEALSRDPEGELFKLLCRIVEWDKTHPPQSPYHGFEWHEVYGDPRTLNSLVTRRILKITFKSNKSTSYRATHIPSIERALQEYSSMTQPIEVEEEIPEDLFNVIVGHEEKKEIIKRSIASNNPVHALLHGTVASAKTLMLEELTRLPRSKFVIGSSLTKAGITEVLFAERPKYLIIDELDKIGDTENLAVLLSLMERGYVSETKYRRHRSISLKTWVFASANDISKIPKELMSRFFLLRFRDYTPEEFLEVAATVLREKEGIYESLGLYIGKKVLYDLKSRDVRDAIKIARLLKEQTKEEVDKLIELAKTQR